MIKNIRKNARKSDKDAKKNDENIKKGHPLPPTSLHNQTNLPKPKSKKRHFQGNKAGK